MKLIFIVFSILYLPKIMAQSYLYGSVEKAEYSYDTYFENSIGANGRIFYISRDKKSLNCLDAITKKSKSLYTISGQGNLTKISIQNEVCYFSAYHNGQNFIKYIDVNNVIHDVITPTTEMTQLNVSDENYLFYSVSNGNNSEIFRFNRLNGIHELIINSTNQLKAIATFANGILILDYNNYNVYSFLGLSPADTSNITSTNFAKLNENDPFYDYFSIGFHQTLRINISDGTILKFADRTFNSLYYLDNNTLTTGIEKLTINNDTLSSIQTYQLKNEFDQYGSVSRGLNFASPFSLMFTFTRGLELSSPDSEDSLSLIYEGRTGKLSSIPMNAECDGDVSMDFARAGFEKNGDTYIAYSNGQDSKVYLAKINSSGVETMFPIEDFNPNIKFSYDDDFVYWIIKNQQTQKIKIFRRSWNDLQTQTTVSNDYYWNTEIGIFGARFCPQNYQGMQINTLYEDDDQNTYVSFLAESLKYHFIGSTLVDTKNNSSKPLNGGVICAKYDKYGQILWEQDFGSKQNVNEKFLAFQKHNGNMGLFVAYYDSCFFENDTLVQFGNNYIYTELDKANGAIIDKKSLFKTIFLSDHQLKNVVEDKDGNMYFIIRYSNYSFVIGNTTLQSDYTFQNAIIKLKSNGDLIWAKNIFPSESNFVSKIGSFQYQEKHDVINALLIPDLSYCVDSPWQGEWITIQCGNAEINSRNSFFGQNDVSDVIAHVFENENAYFTGSFTGKLQVEDYLHQTNEVENYCYDPKGFEFGLFKNDNRFSKINYNENYFIPRKAKSFHDTLYVFGVKENGNSALRKFDDQGRFKGEIEFGQLINTLDFVVSDDRITLAAYELLTESRFNLEVTLQLHEEVVISNFKNSPEIWKLNDYENKPFDLITDQVLNNLSIYPNPSSDYINLLTDGNFSYDSFKIFNLRGELVERGVLNESEYYRIDVSQFESGVYILKLKNKFLENTFKIVKY